MSEASEDEICEEQFVHPSEVAEAKAHLVPEEQAAQLAETFKALADPTRVRLISALAATELCVYDLAEVVGMSQSAISHQLRLLRRLRLVRARRAGRHVFYQLDDEHIHELFQMGLAHVQHG